MSTIDPATEQRVAAAAMARGVSYVNSSVGRSSAHAERGELLLLVGGDPADVEVARPVLMCMEVLRSTAAKGLGKGGRDFTGIITVLEEATGCTVRG